MPDWNSAQRKTSALAWTPVAVATNSSAHHVGTAVPQVRLIDMLDGIAWSGVALQKHVTRLLQSYPFSFSPRLYFRGKSRILRAKA